MALYAEEENNEIQEKYDVFLSFRGEDTRNQFASYLYAALSAKQILTFMDHKLERGDKISPTLRKTIEESKIWVIIFSENFASSTWCLDELVHILECKKRNEQGTVMPIFYGIDPSVVRKQEGSYGVAFAELEKRFDYEMEKVKQWRAALTETSNLCGLDSKLFRPECKLVQEIVKDISLKLPKYLSNENFYGHLIGIEKKVQEIELLLSIGSTDVRIVGILGMGGIGKSTLASVVYQRLSYSHFEGCYFLSNVREEYVRNGPNHLRKKLLCELLNDEAILRMDTPFVASHFILDRLRRKKVFIVLDDVDSSTQLEALVEGYDRLAPGSRIIVTTRNAQVLKKASGRFYKVEQLNHIESLELFRLHAFGKNSLAMDDEIVSEVTRYADGNPLALKVLGSFLHSKSKEEWEIALSKLKVIPNPEIQDVLRISYKGLDDEGIQNIFLDIACLFNSSFTRDHVESILHANDPFVKIGISVLIDRSLIENWLSPIENKLWMHDLIRQMGQTIVRDEHKEPGNRSRLWDAKEICHVLERNRGTATVEGISFNMSSINRDVKVCGVAFSKMYNLRILKIYICEDLDDNKCKLYLPQGLDYLSDKLNYLQWDLYPLKSLPSHFTPENLVELILRSSHVEKLWNHQVQSLPMLRRIDLSNSKFLTQLPDLSGAPNLESINLEGCTSLVLVLSSVQNLDKLTYLNLNGCSKFQWSTGYMDLVRYGGIKNFLNNICDQLKNFTFLRILIQRFTSNSSLYSSQAHISQKFPTNLTFLGLRGTAIEEVPPSIGCLSGLTRLDLVDCERLTSVATDICKLKSLISLDLERCLKLEKFPEILEPMENFTLLRLDRTGIKELPESIENLVSLKELYIQTCKDFEFLPNSLCNLRKLRMLCLGSSSKLEKLPTLPPTLMALELDDCESLKSLPEFPSLVCFRLSATCCPSLENISNWRAPPLLHDVYQWNIFGLDVLCGDIDFYGCKNLDQNTCNNILVDHAVFKILSRMKFGISICGLSSLSFCYPGDQIPKWFSYQSLGTSMNIMLPPYWNNKDFLGFAFCVVLGQSSITLNIHSKLSFKTIHDDRLYEYCDTGVVLERMVSSDHVLMWYLVKSTLQRSHKMDGLNWPSTCSTEASFLVYPTSHDRRVSSKAKANGLGSKYCKIKKFGIWFIYKADMERFDAETKRKNYRYFDEYCEANGSESCSFS